MTLQPPNNPRSLEGLGRGAEISSWLDETSRRELAKELDPILPGTPEEKGRFLDAADKAIDFYFKITIRSFEDSALNERRLQKLARGAKMFAEAIEDLSPDLLGILDVEHVLRFRHNGADPNTALRGAEAAIHQMRIYAPEARVVAELAQKLLRETVRSPRSALARGNVKRSPMAAFIADLVKAYVDTFGQRPSPEDDGCFARALGAIDIAIGQSRKRKTTPNSKLHAPELRLTIGHTKLKRIIEAFITSAPRPTRGRKTRR